MNESADKTVRSQLRIPADLHAKIVEAADSSGRSMNAEILHRLEATFSLKLDQAETELLELRSSAKAMKDDFSLALDVIREEVRQLRMRVR